MYFPPPLSHGIHDQNAVPDEPPHEQVADTIQPSAFESWASATKLEEVGLNGIRRASTPGLSSVSNQLSAGTHWSGISEETEEDEYEPEPSPVVEHGRYGRRHPVGHGEVIYTSDAEVKTSTWVSLSTMG